MTPPDAAKVKRVYRLKAYGHDNKECTHFVAVEDGDIVRCSDYDTLAQAAQEAGTALKALSDRHAGWEHGMGHCICEAHQQARAALEALAKSGVKIE
jgi:hypothetical protein